MKFTHSEPNEFPADVLPHGTFSAEWSGCYLRIAPSDVRVPLNFTLPGTVACTAVITSSTVTVEIALAA